MPEWVFFGMAGKLQYWKEKDGRFWARVAVPNSLKQIIGKTELLEPLGGNRSIAVRSHPAAVARLQAQISMARFYLEPGTANLPESPPSRTHSE